MYKNFADLYSAYGIGPGKGFSRDEMNEAQERAFVNNCFELYEHIGFSEVFGGDEPYPYDDTKRYVGKKFTVLGRVNEFPEDPNGADLETLPMWNIRFEDGFEMAAYPEEICRSEKKNN